MLLALGCTVCWCGSAIFFEAAGRRVGSTAVNLLRFAVALPLLALISYLAYGQIIPTAPPKNLALIAVSGVVGFFIGDMMLFRAFTLIGARLAITMMATTPIITAAISWPVLGQTLGLVNVLGIAITLAGVVYAVTERATDALQSQTRRERKLGLWLGLGGAVSQAVANVLVTTGMDLGNGTQVHAISATFFRGAAGAICFIVLIALSRQTKRVASAVKDKTAMKHIAIGALFGPVIGVSLLLAAFQRTSTAIVSTITATQPIMMVAAVFIARGEKPTQRGVVGAIVAALGVAVLLLG